MCSEEEHPYPHLLQNNSNIAFAYEGLTKLTKKLHQRYFRKLIKLCYCNWLNPIESPH